VIGDPVPDRLIAGHRMDSGVRVPMFGEPRVSPDVAVIVGSVAFVMMAAGAVWTVPIEGAGRMTVLPERGLYQGRDGQE
jgi:hypothetical protein